MRIILYWVSVCTRDVTVRIGTVKPDRVLHRMPSLRQSRGWQSMCSYLRKLVRREKVYG